MSRQPTSQTGDGHTFSMRVDSELVKEIHRLIGVAGLEILSVKQLDKRGDVERELYKLFHGNFDEASIKNSLVVKLFEGRDQFAAATIVEEYTGIRNGSFKEEQRRCLVPGLLQTSQHPQTGIVLDNTFTITARHMTLPLILLRSKTFHAKRDQPELHRATISGGNLNSHGHHAIIMCREAVRMGADFLNGRDLPEGKTRNDYFQYVLAKMYCIHGPTGASLRQGPVPQGWYFKGWMAFYLFGPMAEPALRCRLIMTQIPVVPALPRSWYEKFTRAPPSLTASSAAAAVIGNDEAAALVCHENAGTKSVRQSHDDASQPEQEDQVDAIIEQSRVLESQSTSSAADDPSDETQPDAKVSTLQAFQQIAQRVCDETMQMMSTMQAKLVELQGRKENDGSNAGAATAADDAKKRTELEAIRQEHQSKRQRLFNEYEDVLSMLVEQRAATGTVIERQTPKPSARVSVSPTQPAGTSENQDDVEIFGC